MKKHSPSFRFALCTSLLVLPLAASIGCGQFSPAPASADTSNAAGGDPGARDDMNLIIDDDGPQDNTAAYRIAVDAVNEGSAGEYAFSLEPGGSAFDEMRVEWDFGDGQPHSGVELNYAFSSSGDFLVIARGYDADGTLLFQVWLTVRVPEFSNAAPVALAGPDMEVLEGARVCLDGWASHAKAGLDYEWTQVSGPAVNLIPAENPAIVCFQAPDVLQDEDLVFRLHVSNDAGESEDVLTVRVLDVVDPAGVLLANAGADQSVTAGALVTLDGSQSSGPAGAKLGYQWAQISGPTVTLQNANRAVASFPAPTNLTQVEQCTFRLTVQSGDMTASDDTIVTVAAAASGGGGVTPPQCQGDADCDDGQFCNGVETCVDGICQSGAAPCSGSLCDEATDQCVDCLTNDDCADDLFCNGSETCVAGSCQPGSDPCAGELCSETSNQCVECLVDVDCDDGVFCNGSETCNEGVCTAGPAPCPGQTCDEATDTCSGGSGWSPPIGVPQPEFGIHETVESVYGSADFYTHYVNNAHGAATDTNNPNGSPSKPRLTVPSSLPAGSVVYLAGGTYSTGAMGTITGNGTPTSPVFLRGNPAAMPKITIETAIKGTYFVVEHVDFNGPSVAVNVLGPSDHVAIRRCEVRHADGSGAGICVVGSWSGDDPTIVHNIVLYDNELHELGDLSATTDQDHHGVVVGHHANRIFMLDNVIYNCSGSGLQVNSGFLDTTGDRPAHHVYVGRNHVYNVRQSGLTVKKARDIVFSQNHVHDIVDTPWSTAKGLAYQYAPYNLWYIYNHLHHMTWGINGPSNDGGPGGNVYFVGNVIHDCDQGMIFWNNQQTAYMVANTIHNVSTGINYDNGPAMHLSDNIFSNVTGPSIRVLGRSGATAAASTTTHDLFHNGGSPITFDWGGIVYNGVSALQTGTGKGAGNLQADPRFADPANRDFHLLADSPCIDQGIMPSVYATYQSLFGVSIAVDWEGNPRDVDAGHDIGACER
ncbi:MAG: right-handed parallel beta-helix repeat-containing protein [Phycisphaerae bacterium]|nr:right-handed parallel beta-helix repeat-containing protein [Phycisphaerae bacterium]